VIHADIRDPGSVVEALGSTTFDVVVDWIAYTPEHVETDLSLFSGRVGQYIFISTASAYLKPAALPILESAPLGNPHWAYSRAKIACEERLMRAFRDEGFPVTLVRPSHTYDATKLPMYGRYTVIDRMRRGQPVIVHGDGTSLWVLTHHEDFARGFVGLLGNHRTLGETFHITSDEVLTWNEIFLWLGRAAGVEPQLVHVASETLAAFDAEWGTSLLGDKSHSVIFDNSKLRRYVPDYAATIPFAQGAREVIAWHDAAPERRVVDPAMNALFDRILATVGQIHP
jgi:nucleoside-diphosphate-sugar epimerase